MWKLLVAFVIVGILGTVLFVLIGFNQMAYQISVRPWEGDDLRQPVAGTVSYFAEDSVPETRDEAAALTNPVTYDQKSIQRGEKAYRAYCLACHGGNMDGFGPVGPSLPARIPHLTGERVTNMSDGEIFWNILKGGPVAPPIGESMTQREIWDTINYMRYKQGMEPGAAAQPDTETTEPATDSPSEEQQTETEGQE